MYRPNRIGPQYFIDLDQQTENISGDTIHTDLGTNLVPEMHFPNSSIPIAAHTTHGSKSASALVLSSGESACVGVRIVGTKLNEVTNYNLVVSGTLQTNITSAHRIVPVIGRVPTTGVLSTVAEPQTLHCEEQNDGQTHSFLNSILMGTFNGTAAATDNSDNPIGVGWWIQNDTGGDLTYSMIKWSLAIHRYEADINTFDPSK